ncbi:MAG TPA: hypothetical protein VOA87_15410 [Thermoanaerobaculia bacterium]|nr:hypothetical protein [Thermoanaerobaculia bacterium]
MDETLDKKGLGAAEVIRLLHLTPPMFAVSLAAALCLGACGKQEEKPAAAPAGQAAAPSAELTPDQQQVIYWVGRAADRGNLVALHRYMAEPFGWNGAQVPTEEALQQLRAHDEYTDRLKALLDRGCLSTGSQLLCPPDSATDPKYAGDRATFAQQGGAWKLTAMTLGHK